MAAVTSAMVKELRERTSAGMMDCKKALVESDGDMDKAIEWLREKGLSQAAKKASRIAAEGIVESYIHLGGKIGVLLEVNCETDFVAKTPEFKSFVHSIAMHIAAAKPLFISRSEVPESSVEEEKEIIRAQALNEGKKAQFVDKIVEGRIDKFYKEICLLEQSYIINPEQTIEQLLNEQIAKIGEKISIRRFVRWEMGEGLEKRKDDFAAEVMSQVV